MPGAYWPQPWTCEDGGPLRRGCADGVARARHPAAASASRSPRSVDAFATDAAGAARARRALRAAPRHAAPRGRWSTPVEGWVERLDPRDARGHRRRRRGCPAARTGRAGSRRTPAATCTWSSAAGRTASAPTSTCSPRTGCRSPRPHNSFVVLDGGELVTKDCDAPAGLEPSTVSVLDPVTLLPVAAAAAAPRAVDRAARQRRRERGRRRHDGRLPACASTATPGGSTSTSSGARATGRRPDAATAGTR